METPILDKLLSISDAGRRLHKTLHAAIWFRPALSAEVQDVIANPDDHNEDVYELALYTWTYTAMAWSELKLHWEMSCYANKNSGV